VILTCKAYDLDSAVAAIAPAVAPTGFVLPFLNGIAHIDILNEKFGRHRVLGGTAKIQATIMPDGAIRQFNDWRTLTFGEQSGEVTERVRVLAGLVEAAKGVEAFAVADIVQRMWEKLVHLSTAAAMTCLMRANVGEIVRTTYGRALFLDQLRCGAAIAAANGHAPSAAFMKSWEETFSQKDSQYSTSMLRDIERGGQTEVEQILGFMLHRTKRKFRATRCCSPTRQGLRATARCQPLVLSASPSPESERGFAIDRGQPGSAASSAVMFQPPRSPREPAQRRQAKPSQAKPSGTATLAQRVCSFTFFFGGRNA
jgi:2-dehydropantoate 2-reductase